MSWREIGAILLPIATLWLGHRLATGQDQKAWRREWLRSRIERREDFYLSLLETIDRQHLNIGRSFSAASEQRPKLDPRQTGEDQATFQRNMARSRIMAAREVQDSVAEYDRMWGVAAEALNIGDQDRASEMIALLGVSRVEVFNAMNADLNAINHAINREAFTVWDRLRGARPPIAERFEVKPLLPPRVD